jgi:hypothetical protein
VPPGMQQPQPKKQQQQQQRGEQQPVVSSVDYLGVQSLQGTIMIEINMKMRE